MNLNISGEIRKRGGDLCRHGGGGGKVLEFPAGDGKLVAGKKAGNVRWGIPAEDFR